MEFETHFNCTFSQNSKFLAAGSSDSSCHILDVEKGFTFYKKLEIANQEIEEIVFSNNNKFAVTK